MFEAWCGWRYPIGMISAKNCWRALKKVVKTQHHDTLCSSKNPCAIILTSLLPNNLLYQFLNLHCARHPQTKRRSDNNNLIIKGPRHCGAPRLYTQKRIMTVGGFFQRLGDMTVRRNRHRSGGLSIQQANKPTVEGLHPVPSKGQALYGKHVRLLDVFYSRRYLSLAGLPYGVLPSWLR
jgi:hypothetical protein